VTDADLELVTLAVLGPLNVVLPLVIVSLDLRFLLTPDQRARTWPDATLGAAALLIGPLMLPLHFAMSRRVGRHWGVRGLYVAGGLGVGTAALVLVYGVNLLLAWLIELALTGRTGGIP
jgi:hypothetical protein